MYQIKEFFIQKLTLIILYTSEEENKVRLTCEPDKTYILNKQTKLLCEINNSRPEQLENVRVCFMKECKTIDVNAESSSSIIFNPIFKIIGLQTHIATLNNNLIRKNEYLNFNIKDQPKIELKVSNPSTIEFDDKFFIQTNITVESNSRPKKLNISLKGSGMEKSWYFDSMDVDQVINLRMKGDQLFKGKNTLQINVVWENDINEKFNKQEKIEIELINLNLWQNFYAWVNEIVTI